MAIFPHGVSGEKFPPPFLFGLLENAGFSKLGSVGGRPQLSARSPIASNLRKKGEIRRV